MKMATLEFNNAKVPEVYGLHALPLDIALMGDDAKNDWWYSYYKYNFSAGVIGTEHFDKIVVDWTDYGFERTIASIDTFNFVPGDSMSRKEVAEILYRMKAIRDTGNEYYNPELMPNPIN
jgi:hypothetical protein